MPPVAEWVVMALVLAALFGLHVADLGRRGMRLSTTSFIDPAGVIQVTAWDIYSARRFHQGEFPLWNPLTGLGQPHLANLQTAVLYPLKLPFYITGGIGGHDVYLFLRLVLMGLGPFILLRALGVGRAGSAFGAISFGLGGYALWFENLVELNNQLLTPFLMIAMARLGLGFNTRRFLAVAALVTLDVLGGHPEGIFITILFSSLFAVFRVGRSGLPGAFGRWAAAGIMGFMGAAAVLVPFAEYFPKAWNFHFAGMGFLHIGPKALVTYLSPFFSQLAGGPLWQIPQGVLKMSLYDFYRLPYKTMLFNAGMPYTGLIVTAFMLTAMLKLREMPRGAGFFAAFWIAAMAFAMGLFPFKLLSFLPPFHVTNNAKFYAAEITLCACILAGMAFDRIVPRLVSQAVRAPQPPLARQAVAQSGLRSRWGAHVGAQQAAPLLALLALMAITLAIYFVHSLDAPEIFLQMAPAAVVLALVASPGRGRAWAIIAMLVAELAIMRITVHPYLPVDWNKSLSAEWIKFVKPKTSGFSEWQRIQVQDDFLLPPNLNLVAGIADIRSSDAMFPKAYFDWINRIGGLEGEDVLRDFYPRYYTRLNEKALESRDVAIMGVKYLISEEPVPVSGPYEFREKVDVHIYERRDACPSVFHWMADDRRCEPVRPFQVGAELLKFDTGTGWNRYPVVFNHLRYPGWSACANGRPMRPVDIGIPLQAYDTGAFEGRVAVEFRPCSFSIGLWTSIVTIIFGIVWFVRSERRCRGVQLNAPTTAGETAS